MKDCSKWVNELEESGISMVFDALAKNPSAISLGVGQPDFETPEYIRQAGIDAINKGTIGYTSDLGLLETRSEVAKYLHRTFKADYDPNSEIMLTNGCSQAIDIVLRVLCDPEDELILVNPGYVAYEPIAKSIGVTIVNVDAGKDVEFKIVKENLKKVLSSKTKAILMNYPSNPTGGVMSYEDYAAIVPLLKENGCYIISDEIYTELTYDQPKASLTQFKEIKDQLILINGFSKAYSMTGWRLGYICANEHIITQCRKLQTSTAIAPSTISQYAGAVALRQGDNDIQVMKEIFKQRRDYVIDRLQSMGFDISAPKGAFYVFVDVSPYTDDDMAFVNELFEKEALALIPGSCFGTNGKGFIRLSYAYSQQDLCAALDRLEHFIENYGK